MSGLSAGLQTLLAGLGVRRDDAGALDEVCRACAEDLDVDGAGMTIIVAGKPQGRLGVSGPRWAAVEELQFTAGEGPCLDAYVSGQVVSEPMLASTPRWPGFAPAAAQRGLGAVFAFPLQLGRARFGALDLYRVAPGPLPGDVYADALTVSHGVTAGLLAMLAGAPPGSVPPVLDDMVEARAVVHVAAGMVSVQLNASIEDALVALRARAYATGSTVIDIATQVVERRLRLDIDEDGS